MKIFFIFLFCAATCFANEVDKSYIPSSNVIVGDNGIFVKIDNHIIPVSNISHDETGLYVSSSESSNSLPSEKVWCCGKCFHHNFPWVEYCTRCGKHFKD